MFEIPLEKDKKSVALPPALEAEFSQEKKLDAVFDDPKVTSYTTIEYRVGEYEGRELASGHRIAFIVPEKFRGRIIRDIVLHHRKGEKYRVNIGADGYDPHGAYSRVEVHDAKEGIWRSWRDPKGYNPDKFAEPRSASNPENEVLHDWLATVGAIETDAIRITNVGQHEQFSTSQIHGIEMVFFPELKGVTYAERVYCQGTSFIDMEKGKKLPSYGGGSHTEGQYVGAMALNHHGSALYELGKDPGTGAKKEDSRLVIDLEPGKALVQVEVSVGDSEHLSYVNPKTKRRTRLGYAKLWVGVKRADGGHTDWFIENANIPPQGVIAGGPHLEQNDIRPGDQLVIEARADAAYVMGWRVAYAQKDAV